jgi:PKD repeat protein
VTISTGTTGPTPPVITSAATASATAYSSFSYQITASNSPTYYSASGLPAGLSMNNGTGLISGTPTAAGTFSVTLTASNDTGDGTKTLTLTIAPQPKPVISSATTATAAVNAAFSYQITANNSPTSYDATGLPTGLSVDGSTGVISGTPTATGTNTVSLTASNAGGTGTATLTLIVDPDPNAPVITSPLTATGAVGALFNYSIAASNTPTAYLATGLPAGLTVDPLTGLISGTPAAKGTSTVMIMASNGSGSDTKTLTINILEPFIEVSQTDLSFTASFGLASEAQIYTLTASDITSPLTVLAPGNFEISDDDGASYFDELIVTPALNGTVNAAIKVRMKSSAPLGESSGGIVHSGSDAAPKYVNLTGFSDVIGATMDLSATSLTGFTAKTGAPSFVQSYTLTGAGLSGPVTIAAPPGFQVSADNTTFGNSIAVAPDATGTIAAKEVFVRMLSPTAGTIEDTISHVGGGAAEKYLAVIGTVTAPSGPPIISPLSGSAYTNSAFNTKIMAGGNLVVTNFGASSLPGTLRINTTNGIISGNVPSGAGTNIFAVSATTQDGTTTTNYNLRVVNATQQNTVPTSVVINKFQNGLPDRVELLVIGDTSDGASGPPVDMRGMILKDFSSGRTADEGGEYRFSDHEAWSRVKAGTLVVLSAGTQSDEDLDPSDFVLRVNLGNGALFKQESPNFDIDDLEMIMIKPASMGVEGFAGGVHAMAAGRVSGTTIYGLYTGKKIRSDRSLNSSRSTIYATASSLSGYNSTQDTAALVTSSLEFGIGNTDSNRSYITSLRNLDQTPPSITLVGSATVNLVVGQSYTEQGATVSGGTSSTASVSGSVNTAVAGTYLITYTASDSAGNVGTATRTVIVGKATPTITSAPTASSIIAGQKLSASTLTGGSASVPGSFAWTNPNQVATPGTASYGVTFAPTDTANYISTATTVSVVANQSTAFEAWTTGYNLSGANAQPSSDPDGDGWSNAQEFAFGRNPTEQQLSLSSITLENGVLRAVFLAHKDVTYAVRSTADLSLRFEAPVAAKESADQSNKPSEDYKRMEATLPVSAERAFLRVEAILP